MSRRGRNRQNRHTHTHTVPAACAYRNRPGDTQCHSASKCLPVPVRVSNFKLLITPIGDGFSRLAFSSFTIPPFIDRAATTVYRIFRDFLSLVLLPPPSSAAPSPSPLPLVRRMRVRWKPPRTTEVLIEFIAMLFMRDRERVSEREKMGERSEEADRETMERGKRQKWARIGEKGTRNDRDGKRKPVLSPLPPFLSHSLSFSLSFSASRIEVAVTPVSGIFLSRECCKATSFPSRKLSKRAS